MHKSIDVVQGETVIVVGAGLAGSEAAFQLAQRGVKVELYEMRDESAAESLTPAHKTDLCAELVCSNSFRSSNPEASAVGILQREMKACDSIIMLCAEENKLPAGSALAVDRVRFAKAVTQKIQEHPLITLKRKRIDALPENRCAIIATGPLTAESLAADIQKKSNEKALAFFDAIAPLVYYESLDLSQLWMQSRYDRSTDENSLGDYLNVPLDKKQYEDFVAQLKNADTHSLREWEKNTPYFEGCLPIEVMAERGVETLRFGPMKPVGLTNPHENPRENPRENLRENPRENLRENPRENLRQEMQGEARGEEATRGEVRGEGEGEARGEGEEKKLAKRPAKKPAKKLWAVVQLRRDDREGRLWNIVGFQTKMTYSAQLQVLKSLPGFANAEFARLGGLHRNTFINAPQMLDQALALKAMENVKIAGQLVGVEGYLESAAIGMLAAIFTVEKLKGKIPKMPPQECALGALLAHVIGGKGDPETEKKQNYQPMNINFGLFPNLNNNNINDAESDGENNSANDSTNDSANDSANDARQNSKTPRKIKGREKKMLLAERAEKIFRNWWQEYKLEKNNSQNNSQNSPQASQKNSPVRQFAEAVLQQAVLPRAIL